MVNHGEQYPMNLPSWCSMIMSHEYSGWLRNPAPASAEKVTTNHIKTCKWWIWWDRNWSFTSYQLQDFWTISMSRFFTLNSRISICRELRYPLVMTNITNWKDPQLLMVKATIFYGHFQYLFVFLPEGRSSELGTACWSIERWLVKFNSRKTKRVTLTAAPQKEQVSLGLAGQIQR